MATPPLPKAVEQQILGLLDVPIQTRRAMIAEEYLIDPTSLDGNIEILDVLLMKLDRLVEALILYPAQWESQYTHRNTVHPRLGSLLADMHEKTFVLLSDLNRLKKVRDMPKPLETTT